jgi:predicted NBD/HSP70 family sugar kinase
MSIALGIGIGNLVNIFNPQRIVVGGVLDQLSDLILPITRDIFEKHSLFLPRQEIKIVSPALGADSCVLGCVALVLDEVIRQRAQF